MYLIGVDEVGRGPLAGPITIGVFVVSKNYFPIFKKDLYKKMDKLKDSKKMKESEREEWFKHFFKKRRENRKELSFVTVSLNNNLIDQKGISWCTKTGIRKSLYRLNINPKESKIYLDGLLYAPKKFKNQKTIIKGDEKNELIAAASVVAKVTRDRFMKKLAKEFPEYNFKINKGYGTLTHRKAIKKYGKCIYHRESFCKNI
jgi:ribonuclease HII